mmetsp:Transcript_35334/g.109039  ORF Transcript_35334/g.109039 Transcript_35334/m.109039 type:complete len:394 (-) Transcript_35334:142-1323(-)
MSMFQPLQWYRSSPLVMSTAPLWLSCGAWMPPMERNACTGSPWKISSWCATSSRCATMRFLMAVYVASGRFSLLHSATSRDDSLSAAGSPLKSSGCPHAGSTCTRCARPSTHASKSTSASATRSSVRLLSFVWMVKLRKKLGSLIGFGWRLNTFEYGPRTILATCATGIDVRTGFVAAGSSHVMRRCPELLDTHTLRRCGSPLRPCFIIVVPDVRNLATSCTSVGESYTVMRYFWFASSDSMRFVTVPDLSLRFSRASLTACAWVTSSARTSSSCATGVGGPEPTGVLISSSSETMVNSGASVKPSGVGNSGLGVVLTGRSQKCQSTRCLLAPLTSNQLYGSDSSISPVAMCTARSIAKAMTSGMTAVVTSWWSPRFCAFTFLCALRSATCAL